MGDLRLALLGTPEVRHAGQVLTFRTRKTLALLVYLTVEGGLQSREKLTALFWPESDEERGRMMLRRTLLLLRQSLDDPSGSAHLLADRATLGCDFTSGITIDLHLLYTAIQALRGPREASRHPNPHPHALREARRTLLTQLQAAVDVYRGAFLDGFSLADAPDFEDWTRLQREVWHRRAGLVFDRLSQVQFDGGDIPAALETTIQWVARDPLNEDAYQRLMRLYLVTNDRSAALRAYDACRTVLAGQLNARPAPETEALAERSRLGTLGFVVPAQDERSRTPPSPHTVRPTPIPLTLPEVPFVGREGAYGTLVEVYHATKLGQAHIVTLKGEAGVGKTRLATEFLHWAAAHGADVLAGRAFEAGGRLPYQPLVEALRSRLERENAPDDLLSDVWLAELSRLLPELRDRYLDIPAPAVDEATAGVRLLEAVARLIQALAQRAPVVLFVDDVQWADSASLDVLYYVGRSLMESRTPLLLLLGMRTEALLTTQALAAWLSSLEQNLQATSLALEALPLEDTVRLVLALGGGGGPDPEAGRPPASDLERFGGWLFAETGGQPFYLTETLKALIERGILLPYLQDGGRWAVDFTPALRDETQLQSTLPTSIREVIRTRLAGLTPAAFALLLAGAVLGHAFSFEHLCQLADVSEHEGLAALDEVRTHRLLRESGREGLQEGRFSADTYFFTHDKIRDVVYTEAGDARRRIFHRRALEGLQAAAAPAAELAHHALEALMVEPAFHLSVTAGDEAMQLFAVRDAIAQYEQARLVLRARGQPGMRALPESISLPAQEHLYAQLGRAYELNSEFEQAHAIYQEMLTRARESETPSMECAALNRLATLAFHQSIDIEQALALWNEALQVAERHGETVDRALVAETEWNLAQLSFYGFDADAALAHGKRALELTRGLGQQEPLARSLNVLAYAKMLSGNWEEVEAAASEARLLYQALKNRAMEADCLGQMALASISGGRPQAGIRTAREALTISREIENAWGQTTNTFHLAMGLLEIGDYAEALTCAHQAVTLARTHDIRILLGLSLTIAGRVHRALLDVAAAQAAHLEAMTIYKRAASRPPLIEMVAAELCADYALAGKWTEAYSYAREAVDNRRNYPFHYMGLTRWYETEALVRAGEIERAAEDVQRFGARVGRSRRYRIPYSRSLAVLARYRGEVEAAMAHLQEAATLAEEMDLPGERWSMQAALGELYQQQGHEDQGRDMCTRATEIVQSLANRMGDEQQRTTFLSAEPLRHVLEQASRGRGIFPQNDTCDKVG